MRPWQAGAVWGEVGAVALPRDLDLFALEGALWVASRPVGVPAYDFAFERFFACRRPYQRPTEVTAVGRLGAPEDYPATWAALAATGLRLVNDPAAHERASELPAWYPRIQALTPRSRWYEAPPSADEVEAAFGWPVFVKGARQTARHAAGLAIARDKPAYEALRASYLADPILTWQACVIREYVPLVPVGPGTPGKVPASFEFRTFWWRGALVGAGRYWLDVPEYRWSDAEARAALAVGAAAAARVDVPFLVVDLALTAAGRWVVIECNDGQEAAYAGVSAVALWRAILDHEAAAL
ncbi:MAG: ATP-grasp domain-containing protein [Deltaproteobacteria bacterium]|nr:ATP-grasp domain-containing protein [Deltaproteobacteria bacterium]